MSGHGRHKITDVSCLWVQLRIITHQLEQSVCFIVILCGFRVNITSVTCGRTIQRQKINATTCIKNMQSIQLYSLHICMLHSYYVTTTAIGHYSLQLLCNNHCQWQLLSIINDMFLFEGAGLFLHVCTSININALLFRASHLSL